jgi:hypothetical protein
MDELDIDVFRQAFDEFLNRDYHSEIATQTSRPCRNDMDRKFWFIDGDRGPAIAPERELPGFN